jgi:hypothetical protein
MEIGKIVMEFSKDLMTLVRMVMESNVGINYKTKPPKNTLKGSNLYKTLSVKATNDGDLIFDIILNDYLTFIESGRRKGAKFPPVEPIVKWARSRGIPTDNSTIFLIRRAISRDGIKPRPFMAHVLEEIDREWDDSLADELFNKIISEIDKYFNT